MPDKEKIIYFELNNWMSERDHPDAQPFDSWMNDYNLNNFFSSERWTKQNNLCVVITQVDMSVNYCISATEDWVKKCCPELLTKYKQFIREEKDNFVPIGRFGSPFLEYKKENFGIWYAEENFQEILDEDDEPEIEMTGYSEPKCINKNSIDTSPWGHME